MDLNEYYNSYKPFYSQLPDPYPYETNNGVISVPFAEIPTPDEKKSEFQSLGYLMPSASNLRPLKTDVELTPEEEAELTDEEKEYLNRLKAAGDLSAYEPWLIL